MTQTHTGERKVTNLDIFTFALPAAPLLALGLPTIMFLPQYFIRDLGIEAGAAIFVLARILDVFIDPAIGGLQDRTVSKWGRRRFWLAVSCPILMFFVWWAFLGLSSTSGVIAATIVVLALFSAFASMMIAHLGWAGELIPTYHGRTRVLGIVQLVSLVGQVGVLALAAYVQTRPGANEGDVVAAMGWFLLIGLPITTLIAVVFIPDRPTPPQAHLSIVSSLKAVWDNAFARRVLLVDLLFGFCQGIAGTLFVFYFQFVLGFTTTSNALLFIYFVAGLLGVPLWMWVGRRWGKHRGLQGAFIYTAVTTLMIVIMPAGNFPLVAVAMAVAGLAQGGGILLTRALMADVVDADELETGARRSGLYFGLLLTTSKIAIVAGPLVLVVLQLMGFQAGLGGANSPSMLFALGAAFIGAPALFAFWAAWLLRDYPLDEKAQAELHAAIEARHAANSENTLGPVTK
ncbi:MFS transporter [Terricaulis sp.]|uniref:MFS transporter n=1 Tax=Terricaulis sp. TaxID=2768686 RepID=UPI002AC43338|nr:MFS transporter [Terricaulis sp.]MDZ4689795.1 MFS transporter [Terricaulis sp.]